MRRQRRSIWVFAALTTFTAASLSFWSLVDAGDLEPPGPPGSTMKTIGELPSAWSQKIDPSERFELVMDGAAVLDKETGLVWEKSPDYDQANPENSKKMWGDAFSYCYKKEVGARKGWRLPAADELASLIDMSQTSGSKLPGGHPFDNVQPYYWSSSIHAVETDYAWGVDFSDGGIYFAGQAFETFVWCVRGGKGSDVY